jgi:hypothetical protein
MKESPDGIWVPPAIERVEEFQDFLWKLRNGIWVRNTAIPYWSDDLDEYFFDDAYSGKTYCTFPNENMAVTQDQTIPTTVTLYPNSFTTTKYVDHLGSKIPERGTLLEDILPRSATLYHELFHLTLSNSNTPDVTCKLKKSSI